MWPFLRNYTSYLENLSAYEVAAIIIGIGHWEKSRLKNERLEVLDPKQRPKPWKYDLGDIVLVELGASNYGYEASYGHPCIILANGWNWALVVPCSTGRYLKQNQFIISADSTHGFKHPTGIQLDKIRVIDKWRIKGKVSNPKLVEVSNKLLELYFNPFKKRLENLDNENKALYNENKALYSENKALYSENISLKGKIKELQDKLSKVEG